MLGYTISSTIFTFLYLCGLFLLSFASNISEKMFNPRAEDITGGKLAGYYITSIIISWLLVVYLNFAGYNSNNSKTSIGCLLFILIGFHFTREYVDPDKYRVRFFPLSTTYILWICISIVLLYINIL